VLSTVAVLMSLPVAARTAPPKTPTPPAAGHHDRTPEDVFRVKPVCHDVCAL
jgi:hypothetical protein